MGSKNFGLLCLYVILALIDAILTDIILKNKEYSYAFSQIFKKYCSEEIFLIFGNPGEAAAAKLAGQLFTSKAAGALTVAGVGAVAVDHVATKTGVFDVVKYSILRDSGVPKSIIKETMMKGNSISLIEHLIKKKTP